MNSEYEERGFFKQLVLIAFLVGGWISEKAERAWKSETFWWCAIGLCFAIAVWCLKLAVVR